MIATIGSWIGFLILIIIAVAMLRVYLKAREISNQIMSSSKDSFFEATNSLLETPSDLSENVLDALRVMMTSATEGRSHLTLLKAVKSKDAQLASRTGRKSEIQLEVEQMRPELSELFAKAMISWLGYMTHRNVVTALRIQIAILKLRGKGMDQSRAEVQTGINMLGGFGAEHC